MRKPPKATVRIVERWSVIDHGAVEVFEALGNLEEP